jgi:FkbM family methyltransferase
MLLNKKRNKKTRFNKPLQTPEINLSPIVVFDVGARSGFGLLKNLSSKLDFYCFEPEPTSFQELQTFYAEQNPFNTIQLLNIALCNTNGEATLHLTKHLDMCSLLEPDAEPFKREFQQVPNSQNWFDSLTLMEKIKVKTERIDDFALKNKISNIDFLKIDTQGTELEVLKGAEHYLTSKKISVIKVEASLANMYKKQAFFKDVDAFLREKGYIFLDLIFPQKSNKKWRQIFLKSNKKNQNPVGDAYYILDFENQQHEGKSQQKEKAMLIIPNLGIQSSFLQ